ncbi:MAG TPA: hypothetical protein VH186_37865 [Chloroflexia bacterium]|nr:hypothetical protein [Chloroflexia bacterium]
MRIRNLLSPVLLVITFVVIILLILLALNVPTENREASVTGLATQPTLNLTAPGFLLPLSPAANTPLAGTTSSTAQSIVVITPREDTGEFITATGYDIANLSLKRLATPPLISSRDAAEIVYLKGYAWARGGEYRGRTVQIRATYGLATFGSPGPNGAWLGPQNTPLLTCKSFGQCASSGILLKRLENRPIWLLEYNNLDPSEYPPPPYACPQCKRHDRTIFAVDCEYRAVIYSWTYVSS